MHKIISVVLLLAFGPDILAERFLTIAQAQKLCFPKADRFEEQTLRFTPEQAREIQQRSGVRVLNSGNRVASAWAGEKSLGVMFIDHVIGKHELIDYAVAISSAGEVLQVEILEYRESHGGEIRGKKWRSQFIGKKTGARLKLNDDVYNISGATMSCRHVTEGIRRVLATFDLLCRPNLLPGPELSLSPGATK